MTDDAVLNNTQKPHKFPVLQQHVSIFYDFRLGIKPYVWQTECLRGQMKTNATAFPQALGLAATFRLKIYFNFTFCNIKLLQFLKGKFFLVLCMCKRKTFLEFSSHEVIFNISQAVAIEVRAHWNSNIKHGVYETFYGLSCFSPVINIVRHPLWGRIQVQNFYCEILKELTGFHQVSKHLLL